MSTASYELNTLANVLHVRHFAFFTIGIIIILCCFEVLAVNTMTTSLGKDDHSACFGFSLHLDRHQPNCQD